VFLRTAKVVTFFKSARTFFTFFAAFAVKKLSPQSCLEHLLVKADAKVRTFFKPARTFFTFFSSFSAAKNLSFQSCF
jgi:hypothetical protein